MRRNTACWLLAIGGAGGSAHAGSILINELTPNPAGADTSSNSFIELAGTPGESLEGLFLIFVDSDTGSAQGGLNDIISFTASDTIDANGFFTTFLNFENPSFTVVLSDTDLGDQTSGIDASTFAGANVLDAIGIVDQASDQDNLFAEALGGTDLLFNTSIGSGNEGEPVLVFRDSSTGQLFQVDDADTFNLVADADGELISDITSPFAEFFNFPAGFIGPSPGAINPTLIPAPASVLTGGLCLSLLLARRRRTA